MRISALRNTLRAGSTVFGVSALLLIFLPSLFLDLLGLDKGAPLQWSMRMIGITVFALAGNMWNNAATNSEHGVKRTAQVMAFSAAALGVLTLMIPTTLTWFSYLYAAIGFGFALSYIINLSRK